MTKQRFAFIVHNQRKKACERRMPIQKLIAEAVSRYENKYRCPIKRNLQSNKTLWRSVVLFYK